MADASYVKSLVGALANDVKLALGQAFTYVLDNLRFGAVEHQTRATNFQAYYLTGVTSSNALQEFSIAHGLGRAPYVAFPVLPLDQIGAQLAPLQVSRAADNSRIYLKSASTSAAIALLVE
jgi:hypothetical protein